MEQLYCRQCHKVIVPSKNKAPKYCNRTCYSTYMREIEEEEAALKCTAVVEESDKPFYIKLFFFLVLVSIFIVMFINSQY